jgi:hypothetical protein
MKRIGRGESIGAVINICIRTTQGNSLYSYVYLKLAKCHVCLFIFYVFSSTKLNRFCRGVAPIGGGRWWGKG